MTVAPMWNGFLDALLFHVFGRITCTFTKATSLVPVYATHSTRGIYFYIPRILYDKIGTYPWRVNPARSCIRFLQKLSDSELGALEEKHFILLREIFDDLKTIENSKLMADTSREAFALALGPMLSYLMSSNDLNLKLAKTRQFRAALNSCDIFFCFHPQLANIAHISFGTNFYAFCESWFDAGDFLNSLSKDLSPDIQIPELILREMLASNEEMKPECYQSCRRILRTLLTNLEN